MTRSVPFLCRAFLLVGLLVPATTVSADPVTGTFRVTGAVTMFGEGGFRDGDFSVDLATQGFLEAAFDCLICEAGTTTSFFGHFADDTGTIDFGSDTFVLPRVEPDMVWTVVLPFSFEASGFDAAAGIGRLLQGTGTVTAEFFTRAGAPFGGEGPYFNFLNATFVAGEPSAAPTPEPTSLVLLATGLTGAVLRRRRARR